MTCFQQSDFKINFGRWSGILNHYVIPLKNFNIKTCFLQFLWFFRLKCWLEGQIISRIQVSLPNAYKLMCFDRNIKGNRDVKFLECDYLLVQRCVKLTLIQDRFSSPDNIYPWFPGCIVHKYPLQLVPCFSFQLQIWNELEIKKVQAKQTFFPTLMTV